VIEHKIRLRISASMHFKLRASIKCFKWFADDHRPWT